MNHLLTSFNLYKQIDVLYFLNTFMKTKLAFLLFFLASNLSLFSQNQVPNGDFEEWFTSASCKGDSAAHYATGASLLYFGGGLCPTATGITKSTNSYSGTYALQLTPLQVQLTEEVEYSISVGNLAYLTSTLDVVGIPFTGRPTKLTGYTKFTKGGDDTLGIYIEMHDSNGNPITYNAVTISATQPDYTKFEIFIPYDHTNTTDPGTLVIGFGLGNKNILTSSSSVALIDALSFEYGITTAAVHYTSAAQINVFAAQKNIHFSEQVSDVHVVDMVGAQKIAQANTTQTINAGALNSGLYIVTYKYKDSYFSKKVVIE